jgi:hypothetical protein
MGWHFTLTSTIDRAIADPSCDGKQSKSEGARDAWQCGGDWMRYSKARECLQANRKQLVIRGSLFLGFLFFGFDFEFYLYFFFVFDYYFGGGGVWAGPETNDVNIGLALLQGKVGSNAASASGSTASAATARRDGKGATHLQGPKSSWTLHGLQ